MAVAARLKPSVKSVDELSRYQRRRRVVIASLVVVIFMALLFVRSAADGRLHENVEVFGIGAILIAILGRTWCTLYIGGRKSSEIVTGGPYSV
ncbi:MAG TPA: isoprenylcysteine carboxylmethyltransferase family protein, partial [Mesorhizobium sp.]|nr:isoprenylcysteine carboxylmethyltransferase family protein [Mesorhizobium sp.]